jgi:glyoxylase-like metal-dependent hydrolase (beta-lactamase superfamily II)
MHQQLKVGDIEIVALSDGMSRLPRMFFPGLDFAAHPEVLDEDGTVHIPTGCFLIRTSGRTILVDAGLGPLNVPYPEGMPTAAAAPGDPTPFLSEGGLLPWALAAAGCAAAEVDTVFLTHLHPDHVGWVGPEGKPYFHNATVVYGAADWEPLVVGAPDGDPGRRGMEAAASAGRTEPIAGDMVAIAPGVTARHAPGHTPGHYVLVIASGAERAYLLGDAVQCPLQLTEADIAFLTDVDAALAARTRETLFREMEDHGAAVGMDHFPGLEFQRIIPGVGRRWVTFGGVVTDD